MDLEGTPPSTSLVNCSDCGCTSSLMSRSYSGTWLRSVKRKFREFEEGNSFVIPGFDHQDVARVEFENECGALREMVGSQQQTIQELSIELEEERNASSSAANEAMSMILRLQREKAEIQMEARQFKRFAEEKMAHDQHELFALEDLLYKREQGIQSLFCEVQSYKHKMMSYGLTEAEMEGERGSMTRNNSVVESLDSLSEFPTYNYPPLKCNWNENQVHSEIDNNVSSVEKYAFDETPRSRGSLKDLEYRINQLEGSPRGIQRDEEFPSTMNVLEKVIVGQSPKQPRHFRRFSSTSSGSLSAMDKEKGPDFTTESQKYSQTEDLSNLKRVDDASENGDDMSDRVYTIDSVHQGEPYNDATEPKAYIKICEDYITTPRESLNLTDVGDPEIQKLYMRLQALEADRESMRQAIISMRTDKAQLVLLKEIAQHLCNEVPPARRTPVRKSSLSGGIPLMSLFKWIVSFVFWRKKAHKSKYMSGLSANNVGLRMLLDYGPHVGQWRCVTSTKV
ncbi:myosin-binding protein 7-like isoform X2 [Cornus florida]|uniref:myosin-binding protein 7-like isoform X2 n=1 Tax=Cornus florida TaxID=4283 RepID=UPI00289759D5|nr:myosin-binding protein 7-like isoform X2 [Cornus florida]XP_059668607.1 myosin-binding protein 7-like isoform X2 [Cornus florida]XP_059668608.1 myosin-binding protein 7-like isoform X2 [Cornus florida]